MKLTAAAYSHSLRFFLNCGASWRIKVMIHHNVLLVKRLTALTFNIQFMRCVALTINGWEWASKGLDTRLAFVCAFPAALWFVKGEKLPAGVHMHSYIWLFFGAHTLNHAHCFIKKWSSSIERLHTIIANAIHNLCSNKIQSNKANFFLQVSSMSLFSV